jgi:hypothetical protein
MPGICSPANTGIDVQRSKVNRHSFGAAVVRQVGAIDEHTKSEQGNSDEKLPRHNKVDICQISMG